MFIGLWLVRGVGGGVEAEKCLYEVFFSHPLYLFFTPCVSFYAPENKVRFTRAELLLDLNSPICKHDLVNANRSFLKFGFHKPLAFSSVNEYRTFPL
jgi:hypothetical protein